MNVTLMPRRHAPDDGAKAYAFARGLDYPSIVAASEKLAWTVDGVFCGRSFDASRLLRGRSGALSRVDRPIHSPLFGYAIDGFGVYGLRRGELSWPMISFLTMRLSAPRVAVLVFGAANVR